MQLTEHFSDAELGVLGCEERLIANASNLCAQLLEPIREYCGAVHVNCGYRDPSHNARVGGKAASFHLFAGGRAAADITVRVALPAAFDWIRLESGLKFDKVILETNEAGDPRCIHLQIDSLNAPRREAYIGETGNADDYRPMEVR